MLDKKKSDSHSVIEPVPLEIIESASTTEQESVIGWHRWLLWASLLALLCVLAVVVIWLPKAVQSPKLSNDIEFSTEVEAEVISVAPVSTSLDEESVKRHSVVEEEPGLNVEARRNAEQLLSRIIELEKDLQKHAVQRWAANEFLDAQQFSQQGDESFRLEQMQAATKFYQQALDKLVYLKEQIEPHLQQALQMGEQALDAGNAQAAIEQFELAQSIDAQNQQAKIGLQRTATIEELMGKLQTASRLESHQRLEEALDVYEAAYVLDQHSIEAEQAITRITGKLEREEFESLLASAYQAMRNRQYSDARNQFQAALIINPSSSEAKSGLVKLQQMQREEEISALLFEARHHVDQQQWQQAANAYQKIQKLDANHAEANINLDIAQRNAQFVQSLQNTLNSVDSLYEEAALLNAEYLLARIEQYSSDAGDEILMQAQRLQEQVRIATMPVSVVLESDQNTQVVVYKVARLGTFKRHQLRLRPGIYTIAGSRPGFRDVRVTLKIMPGQQEQVVQIRCNEPI